MNIIVKDKFSINKQKICYMLNHWLKVDYEHQNECFELHYKNIERKIIAEEYIQSIDSLGLVDYKVHCFNGEPAFIQVIGNRNFETHTFDDRFYDKDWNTLNYQFLDENLADFEFEKPEKLDKLMDFSRKLSKQFKYVRVDFYIIDNEIFLGEMTFQSRCGYFAWKDKKLDKKLGKKLKLPSNNKI